MNSINFEDYLSTNYPQLNETSFLDYHFSSPISAVQIQTIKSLSHKLIPSPHSSEEQSDFDRTLTLLRSTIADLFSTSLINYSVVLYQTREEAIDQIFESFPWNNGSHYIIHPNFDKSIQLSKSTFNFANKLGAHQILKEDEDFSNGLKKITKSNSHSLFLNSFYDNDESLQISNQYLSQGFGVHHVLLDATPAAPFQYPNLSTHSFDFVLLSFKKICGIELCALLIKLQSAEQLKPQFYGGGAVAFSCARSLTHRNFKSHTKRLENGTPLLLSIFASYRGLIDIINLVKTPLVFPDGSTGLLPQKVDQLIEKVGNNLTELGVKNIVDLFEKKVTLLFDDQKFSDPKALQLKYIENKIIIGITCSGQICASFGFGVREADADRFIEVTKLILSQ